MNQQSSPVPVLLDPAQDPASLLDGQCHVALHLGGRGCEKVLPGLELISNRNRVAANLGQENSRIGNVAYGRSKMWWKGAMFRSLSRVAFSYFRLLLQELLISDNPRRALLRSSDGPTW